MSWKTLRNNATSIISFETDTLAKLTFIERVSTAENTAYGELAEFLTIVKYEA